MSERPAESQDEPPGSGPETEPEEEPLSPEAARNSIVFLAVVVEGGLILLALLAGWLIDQNPLTYFTLDGEAIGWGLLGTIPMLLAFVLTIRWPLGPLERIKRFTESVIRPFLAPCTVVDMLGISCLAGLGEEMLFRGVFQEAMAARMPMWLAIVVGGILFGLLHAVTVSYAALATVMGAYLGWLYVQTGNLMAPIVTHAAYDFLVLLYVLRGPGSDKIAPPLEEEEEDEDDDEDDQE